MPETKYHIDKGLSEQEGCLVITISNPRKQPCPAYSFLVEQELKFQKKSKERSTITVAHVPYPQNIPALKLLAGTGQLYFNNRPLVCDFYSRTNLEGIDLKDCDFLCGGASPWYIKGIFLRMIKTELTWSELKQRLKGEVPQQEVVREPTPLLLLKDRTGAFADLSLDYGDGQCFSFHDLTPNNIRLRPSETAWEKDLLETDFIKKMVGSSHYFCPMVKVAKSLTFLLEVGWTIHDWQGRRVLPYGKTELSFDLQSDAIFVKGKIRYDTYAADVSSIVGAFNRRERFLQLGQNAVALLPDSLEAVGLQSLPEEGEIIGDAIRLPKSRFALLDDISAGQPVLADLKQRLTNFTEVAVAPPSPQFTGTLRPYQQVGVNWLQFLYDYGFHGLLADDMGLGKTVQVLAFLSRLEITAPLLVVLPTSLLFNWKREIEHFLPTFPVLMHHGPARSKIAEELDKPWIILTTYATLRLDLPWLSMLSYQCVILDEGQAIKNAHTQTAQAVYRLQARYRLSLTGTPLENRLNELWSQFRFLIPDLFVNETSFEAEIQAAAADSRYLKRIQKKIRPFLLRRKKIEVAKDLPERIEQVVWVELEESQRRLYDEFLAGMRGGLLKKVEVDGLSKHRMEVLEALLRLRQICCDPMLVSGQLDESTPYGSSKLETLLQDVETVVDEGRKALVYSQFTTMLGLIAQKLRAMEIPFVYLDGSTTNREKVVMQFQEDAGIPLFLISLKAGGIGLNLTAADYVFLYDPWWNEAIENQAIDRAHRIGRKDTVIAKRYVAVETVEEKIMKLKAHKRALVDGVLDDELETSVLSAQDLEFLLK